MKCKELLYKWYWNNWFAIWKNFTPSYNFRQYEFHTDETLKCKIITIIATLHINPLKAMWEKKEYLSDFLIENFLNLTVVRKIAKENNKHK